MKIPILLCAIHLVVSHSVQPYHPGPIDCSQIYEDGHRETGIYRIWPLNWPEVGSFLVYCDMETAGGGWTLLQRRGNFSSPADFFLRTWKEYKRGFGKLDQDFWLGNNRIFSLTNQGNYTLRVDIKDEDGQHRYATYRLFWVENEEQYYRIHVEGFNGHSGYSLDYANGQIFSTVDSDESSCAKKFKGGWWFASCLDTDPDIFYLNGPYQKSEEEKEFITTAKSSPFSEMKIRPIEH